MPVRGTEGRHHRPGPLSRSRTGQRALFLGRRRHSLPAVAAERGIFKEVHDDTEPDSASGNLDRWAEQGVLLLNAVLTVRAHRPPRTPGTAGRPSPNAVVRAIAEAPRTSTAYGGDPQRNLILTDSVSVTTTFIVAPICLSPKKTAWPHWSL